MIYENQQKSFSSFLQKLRNKKMPIQNE